MSDPVTATFVFTDLVDSTAMASRLGPEAAEELRRAHYGMLRAAAASTGGLEVKSTGDGLMLMFTGPSRALACATAIQQGIRRFNQRADEPLLVRVGVSMGEATEGEGDYYGDCVVEAARLCAAAEGGQILTTELLRAVLGRHATQEFVPVGDLVLKGLPDPVPAVELRWVAETTAGAVPLPARLLGVSAGALFGFFGRAAELEWLSAASKRATVAGRTEVVLVAGEPGIGKTALSAQVCRALHGEGATVLFGHCAEGLVVPYQPWIEVLSHLIEHAPGEVLSEHVATYGASVARLVPAMRRRVTDGGEPVTNDPDGERFALFEAVTGLLRAAASDAPIVAVLDDLQWADTATLQLLRHVLSASPSPPMLVIGTYRDSDLSRDHPLTAFLADMRREPVVERMMLRGLDDRELLALLEGVAGYEMPEQGVALAHALYRETDGNPFFAGELLRHLYETGAFTLGDDGQYSLTIELDDVGLPGSVRDVVTRRVDRLGAELSRVLSLAAVIGREFDLELLSLIAELDVDTTLSLLETATQAALVSEQGELPGRFRFEHVLIQHTLYEELSATRRQRAHHRIAEALETRAATQDAATLAELARHWVAATRPAELDKALGYVRRAGDAARDALAPDDAIGWYQQALDLLGRQTPLDEHQRAELLAALGIVQRQAAHPEYRDTLRHAADLAQHLGDADLLAQVALGFKAVSTGGLVGDDEAKPIIRAALDRIGPDASPTRAQLLAALAAAHDAGTEWKERRALAIQAVDMARQTDDGVIFIDVLDTTHSTMAAPDRVDEHIDDVERAVAIADRIGDPMLRHRTRYLMAWARYEQADIASVDAVIAEMEAITDAVGLPFLRWALGQFITGRLLLAGRAEDAEAANNRTLDLGTAASGPEALAIFGGLLYAIRQHQGRLDEIADFFLDAARDNPSIAALRTAVVLMLCDLGHLDEAREHLAAEAATGFEYPYDTTWPASIANVIDAAVTTEYHPAARTLVERLTPFAHQVIAPAGPLAMGAVARPLARAATLLGDYDQAESWFAIAHDIHARLQAPYWTALGQLDHADLCLARDAQGDIGRARAFAATAATTASEYGCTGLARRAAALLTHTRHRRPGPT